MSLFHFSKHTVGSTARIEAYTDAVIAIIITLLVLELHVPELQNHTVTGVLNSLRGILPQLASFAFSFLTISVFWVNHHHFFHEVERSDWQVLWYNNFLLFWLALIPFTTAFLGDNPMVPGVLMVYSFVLFMAAFAFMLLTRHIMCTPGLLDGHITDEQKAENYRHGWVGVVLYGIATVIAPIIPLLSVILIVILPIYYVVPRLMHDHEAMTD